MAVNTPAASSVTTSAAAGIRRHQWASVLRAAARTRRGAVGLALASVTVLTAVIGPFAAPDSPDTFVTLPFARPSGHFLLGGDFLGRDVLSRVLTGGWLLLLMALAATAIGVATGVTAGMSAAYLRGRSDGIIMRTVDVILAFPQLVFALLLLSLLGPRLWLIVLAVGVSHAPAVARVMRSAGFGQPPPTANWGTMINENRIGLPLNPWAVIAPAALIAVLTIGTNTFTDAFARVAIGVERRPEEAVLVSELNPEAAE